MPFHRILVPTDGSSASLRGLDTAIELRGQAVADTIVAEAKRRQADVIVVGTHGRSGLRRALLGSSAEGVVRQADVPVLLIRVAPAD